MNWSVSIPEKRAASVTGTKLRTTGPVSADSRQYERLRNNCVI